MTDTPNTHDNTEAEVEGQTIKGHLTRPDPDTEQREVEEQTIRHI